ncbi:H(+)/Cl(-) exchange transporter 5, partial [Aplysia californica]|uniref:H(+)/Cl(-) exchange transporter 5 n=1 Tax=Aplysia californica TaxID=6500 RepID=A0ABM1VR33_APLCA
MDPRPPAYRTVSGQRHGDRPGPATASSTDDDSLLDIVMDGRDDQGLHRPGDEDEDPNQLQWSSNIMDTLDDLPPGIGQYDDFHTIDWLRDIARDR